ncbi:cell division topological specificity factor MinE [Rubritepida flocculans]|uniref:cell division topological specificity factor MinE n=1 Tax=Rubritepida flocculans TaxID=182403 RepID=UPI00040D3A3B|nr:cell division topological specificity factor MinE [Rubritepida flocculans]
MSWLSFFRGKREEKGNAALAKDRLQIILAHERASRDGEDFLPRLQQELLAVVARYVQVDANKVQVNLERGEGMSTLAIGVELPAKSRRNAAA